MFLFKKDNRFRVLVRDFLEHKYFDDFIYNLIGMNSLLLLINYPTITDDYTNHTIDMIVNIISGVFIGEAALKIIAKGFVIGEDTYLKDSWNILDFLIVISAILNWVLNAYAQAGLSFMRGFRALRALRPLRMISKDEGMKTVVNSLLKAIPNLFNVALIELLTILVFSILGVQLFKGELGSCTDSSITYKKDCIGSYTDDSGALQERSWGTPFNNFDNVIWGMITLFEITTEEGWPNTLTLIT